jgi:lycopene beta-cyclase
VLTLAEPHGLRGPIVMDATVPQRGDYRFVYTLPFGSHEVMVEDTRYSDTAGFDTRSDAQEIHEYAQSQGWTVTGVGREESGALPITLGGDIDAFWKAAPRIPRIGLRAALFHATTGYSLPDAVRTADAIASSGCRTTEDLHGFMVDRSKAHWRSQAFWRFLNRMLFIAAYPDQRRGVMERFYGLRQPLIERFYAGRSTTLQKLRVVSGKPPVDVIRAMRCIPERSAAKIMNEATT